MNELHIECGLPYIILDYASIITLMAGLSEEERRRALSECQELITSYYHDVDGDDADEEEAVYVDISGLALSDNQFLGRTEDALAVYCPAAQCFYIYDRNSHVWDASPLSHHVNADYLTLMERRMGTTTVFDIKHEITRIAIDLCIYIFDVDAGTTVMFNVLPDDFEPSVFDVIIVMDDAQLNINLAYSVSGNYIVTSSHTNYVNPYSLTVIPDEFELIDAAVCDGLYNLVLLKRRATGEIYYGALRHGQFSRDDPGSAWRKVEVDGPYNRFAISGNYILAVNEADISDYDWVLPAQLQSVRI